MLNFKHPFLFSIYSWEEKNFGQALLFYIVYFFVNLIFYHFKVLFTL